MRAAAGETPRAAVVDRGTGRPLLLLHGWGVSSDLFAPILAGLEPGRRLIVPDLPGFGATPEPDAPWSVHEYAAWCVALLDRLGIKDCDVIGHSNGGRIGIVLAAEHPERIGRMVLAGSAGIRPKRTLRDIARVRTYKALRAVERSPLVPVGLRRYAQRRADRLPASPTPVTRSWGEQDTEAPIDDGRLMERLIPDAGLVVFEGAGHYAYLEQPDRFRRIVDVFLRDATAADGA